MQFQAPTSMTGRDPGMGSVAYTGVWLYIIVKYTKEKNIIAITGSNYSKKKKSTP